MKSMKELPYHYGLKMRIYPSSKQKEIIKLNGDVARQIYNIDVAMNTELFYINQVKGVYIEQLAQRKQELTKRLKKLDEIKNAHPNLYNRNIDSTAIANARRNYRMAWNNFRKVKKAGIPQFHHKYFVYTYQSTCGYSKGKEPSPYTGSIHFVDQNHLRLPKVGVLRVSGSQKRILSRKTDFRIGTVTVRHSNTDKYYVSVLLASPTPFVKPKPMTGRSMGVDLNIENFLATSQLTMVENPRYYQKALIRLQHAQRKLARRRRKAETRLCPLSQAANYQKQRRVVAKIYEHVANCRTNFIQTLTSQLLTENDVVVAERLLSSNMQKNHHLAQSISDVGWREFLTTMNYKAQLWGKTFIMVDPKNTTQTCSNCGSVMGHNGHPKLTLRVRNWTCPDCGAEHIRDCNAAQNILIKGLNTIQSKEKDTIKVVA